MKEFEMSIKDGRDQVYINGRRQNRSPDSKWAQDQRAAQDARKTAVWMDTPAGKAWKQGKIDRGEWQNFSAMNKPRGGCFITTAVCKTLQKPDDCDELMKFRYFRDTFMQETEEMRSEVIEYYEIAPRICYEIEKHGEEFATEKYAMIWETSLKSAFEALDCSDKTRTHKIYKNMVLDLKKEFIRDNEF
jgi:hypothetical protein